MNNLPSNNIKLIVSVPSELKWAVDDYLSTIGNNNKLSSELTTHKQSNASMFYDYMNPMVMSTGD